MIPITRPELPPLEDYTRLLEEIWASRMLSNFGPMAQRLERLTSDYLGVPTMVVVSGDIGLTLLIAALDLPKGSGVLLPSFTFNSTVNAVLWNGLRPVFVDIDPQTLTMDPSDARAAASASGDAKLIIATHVFGNPADADGLRAVADDFGARLIFDAAHGYGAVRDGVHVGGLGDAEVFSLSGTKPVTSAEGGLIATKDPEILRRIKLLRGYGFLNDYETKVIGLNGKMSELHAALGLLTMQRVDDALAVRDGHVARYHRLLGDLSELRRQVIRPQDRSTFKDFALIFEETAMRDSVELAMGATDIQTKRYFRPCHTMSAYGAFDVRPMPVTESVYSRILCVPLFETLTDEQIDRVCSTVRRAIVAA